MATMKLSVLRYLVAFADEGTFSRAAERCHVSQPTLSVAVQNLEDELGVRLIERGKGHAALTPVGERVVAQARRVLEETRRIETVAEGGRDHLGGEFRLGVIHTVAPYLLPELIGAMRSLAPDARLFIEESMTSLLIDALKYGKVDAVIVALPFDQPGVCVRPLYDEPFRVVVPRAHAWAERREIRRATCARLTCWCSRPATAFASRCSTRARRSATPTARCAKGIRSRRCAAWSLPATAFRCCRPAR